MRVGMNKTKVMISGERQTVRQKAVRWPCGVCSKYKIFLLVCINNTVLRGLVVIADSGNDCQYSGHSYITGRL